MATTLCDLCEAAKWAEVRTRLKASKPPPAKQLNYQGDEGLTPLAHACLEEVVDVVEMLLKAGADPRVADDEGSSCLHVAATLANAALIRILCAHRKRPADVNAADKSGTTPLHHAVEAQAESGARAAAECVEALLAHGAKPDVKNRAGKTPLDLAAGAGEVRSALEAAASAKRGGGRRKQRGNEPAFASDGPEAAAPAAAPAASGAASGANEEDEEAAPAGGRRRGRRVQVGVTPAVVSGASERPSAGGANAEGAARPRRRRPGADGPAKGAPAGGGAADEFDEFDDVRASGAPRAWRAAHFLQLPRRAALAVSSA